MTIARVAVLIVVLVPLAIAPVSAEKTAPPFENLWTIDQVVDALAAGGLEYETPIPLSAETFPFYDHMAVTGERFMLPSLCEDCGARLFVFEDADDLAITQIYYETLGQAMKLLFSWVFTRDNVLIQLNGKLPEDRAREYETALNEMVGMSAAALNSTKPASAAETICICDEDAYNCEDPEAEGCYRECKRQGAGDVHGLDRDDDSDPCESQ